MGLDFFPSYITHTAGPKKLKILQLFIIRIADHRFKLEQKIAPKAHARVQFCSDPVRSHAYFPEWNSAFMLYVQSHPQGLLTFKLAASKDD
jgi:hypothetical protein